MSSIYVEFEIDDLEDHLDLYSDEEKNSVQFYGEVDVTVDLDEIIIVRDALKGKGKAREIIDRLYASALGSKLSELISRHGSRDPPDQQVEQAEEQLKEAKEELKKAEEFAKLIEERKAKRQKM
jgi:hypothetical protein